MISAILSENEVWCFEVKYCNVPSQIHLLDAKRQCETEVNLHANTKELLKNAQKEIAALKQQLHNMEAQIASQSLQRAAGQGKGGKEYVASNNRYPMQIHGEKNLSRMRRIQCARNILKKLNIRLA